MIETINKIVRTQRLILSEFGREATPEELAQKLRILNMWLLNSISILEIL